MHYFLCLMYIRKKSVFPLNMFTRGIWELHRVQGDAFWHFFTKDKTTVYITLFQQCCSKQLPLKEAVILSLAVPPLYSHWANAFDWISDIKTNNIHLVNISFRYIRKQERFTVQPHNHQIQYNLTIRCTSLGNKVRGRSSGHLIWQWPIMSSGLQNQFINSATCVNSQIRSIKSQPTTFIWTFNIKNILKNIPNKQV